MVDMPAEGSAESEMCTVLIPTLHKAMDEKKTNYEVRKESWTLFFI